MMTSPISSLSQSGGSRVGGAPEMDLSESDLQRILEMLPRGAEPEADLFNWETAVDLSVGEQPLSAGLAIVF